MRDLPSPRQLRYLTALSETLHFGRAADMCAVTQSTLSAGVKELEATLGVVLLERSKRSVRMTPLGRMIAARAREALQYMEDMVDLAQSGNGVLAGPLNFGVIPTIGPYLLPGFLAQTQRAFPKLKIFVREERTAPLLERLYEGALDVALIALPYETTKLGVAVVGEEDVVVCLKADHPLAKKKTVKREELAQLPMLMLEDGHCLRDHALAACKLTGRRSNEVYQATSLGTLVQMVSTGLGATLLPRMAARVETQNHPAVCVRDVVPATLARQIALVWRTSAVRAADYPILADALRRVFTQQRMTGKAR
jgi:LysR family transcriptional regulator, hydrogen peroxide-inducible genes activator